MGARFLHLIRSGELSFGLKQAMIVAVLAIAASIVGAIIRS